MAEGAPAAAPAKTEVKEVKKEAAPAKVEAITKATTQKMRSYIWDKIRYVFSGKWLPWGKHAKK